MQKMQKYTFGLVWYLPRKLDENPHRTNTNTNKFRETLTKHWVDKTIVGTKITGPFWVTKFQLFRCHYLLLCILQYILICTSTWYVNIEINMCMYICISTYGYIPGEGVDVQCYDSSMWSRYSRHLGYIATGSTDYVVSVREYERLRTVSSLLGHKTDITALAFVDPFLRWDRPQAVRSV